MINLSTQVTMPETVLFRDLEGEAILLETETGRYYGLDEVGTRMWLLLQRHGVIEPVYQELLGEYEVPSGRLCQDLLGFVEIMASRRLLKIQEDLSR